MRLFSALFAISTLAAVVVAGGPPSSAPMLPGAAKVPAAEKPAVVAVSNAQPVKATAPQQTSVPSDYAAEEERAQELLGNLKKAYQHLDGVTVEIADTPKNEQAISYYTTGEILVDPDHEAGLDEILAHEIWHVIDWRDNGRLDWGENLPPSNSSDYLAR